MNTVISGLYAAEPEPLGFGPSLEIRAFLLQREGGNLLIYRSAALEQDVETVNGLGGISRQYLNHHHEASPACDRVADTFGAPLHVHEDDAAAAAEICNVDATFSERHKLDEDFEVIPIPGHTGGATAFLWDSGQHSAPFDYPVAFSTAGSFPYYCSVHGSSMTGVVILYCGARHPKVTAPREREGAGATSGTG